MLGWGQDFDLGDQKLMLNLSGSNVQVSLFTKDKILIKNVSTRYMYLHGKGHLHHHYQDTSHSPIKYDNTSIVEFCVTKVLLRKKIE